MGKLWQCSVGNGGHRLSSVMWSRLPGKITRSTECECEHCHCLGTVMRSRTDRSRRARPGGRPRSFSNHKRTFFLMKRFSVESMLSQDRWRIARDSSQIGRHSLMQQMGVEQSRCTHICPARPSVACSGKCATADSSRLASRENARHDVPRIGSPVTPSSTIGQGFKVDKVNLV